MHWFNDYYASRNNCYLGDEMRYKCIVSYDGTCFHGFQVQPNLRTVQEEIEKVFGKGSCHILKVRKLGGCKVID